MKPLAKQLLNSLRCPICNGQLDLIDIYKPERNGCNFTCVIDSSHYSIFLNHWDEPAKIEREALSVNENNLSYKIIQDYKPLFNSTLINIQDLQDPGIPSKKITIRNKIFDFNKINKDTIINQIKTVLTFY